LLIVIEFTDPGGRKIGQKREKQSSEEIEIKNRGKKNYRKDKKQFDFDMIISGSSKDLVDYDPYPKWHSDNIGSGGSNQSGFVNEQCDRIIEKIRTEKEQNNLNKLYSEFQQIIYDEQPVIFLYVPTNNIIINSNYEIITSVKKPGYFANTVQIKQ
jgi:peptide/nickel transport system substrate-binding protein